MRKENLLRYVVRRGVVTRPELPSCLLQLLPQDTGLPMSIHASVSRWWLTPRVEVFRTYNHTLTYDNTFSVTIPRNEHSSWIGHWYERPGCSDFDLFDKLRKISGKLTHESFQGHSSASSNSCHVPACTMSKSEASATLVIVHST